MRKSVSGTATVEAAFVMPLVILIFVVSLRILFYSHDQNVIGAAAYETVVIGSNRENYQKEALEDYFEKRIEGRTMLFAEVEAEVTLSDESIEIVCKANSDGMKIIIERAVKKTEPEKMIRNIRKFG